MNHALFLIVLLLTNLSQKTNFPPEGLLFSKFTTGTVFLKDGSQIEANLNYDTFEEQMIFKNGQDILALANPGKIDHVSIQGRTFVWFQKDIFLEEIDTASVTLYQRHRSQLESKGKETSYGGVSQSSAVSTVNSLARGYDKQSGDLAKKEKFAFEPNDLIYLKMNGQFKMISNPKQISRAFKIDKKILDNFIQKNSIKLMDLDDLVRLINYCKEELK